MAGRRGPGDYNVRDSSIHYDQDLHKDRLTGDPGIRVGIVRSNITDDDGLPLIEVECFKDGMMVMLTCQTMTRFGGAHNFEEFGIQPYYPKGISLLPESAVQYDSFGLKNGDNVVVAAFEGDWRYGVILGGLSHGGRKSTLEPGTIAYRSCFNGLDTEIRDDGTWLITHNGKAANAVELELPPIGKAPSAPVYNPLTAGSYMGFDVDGSWTVSDNQGQSIRIKKDVGNISIISGSNRIEIGSTDVVGNDDSIGIQTSQLSVSCSDVIDIFSLDTLHLQGLQEVSIKGLKVAIGNDVFELIAGLIKILDIIGSAQVSSPVGPCTPLNLTSAWVELEVIKAKMSTLQGDLVDADQTLTNIVLDPDKLTGSIF